MIPTLQLGQVGRRTHRARALDNYTSNLWGACWLSKVRSNYTGSCFRVRRSSDNAEQDIGFVGRVFDSAALASFVGANDGHIVTFYDQSGNGRNFAQATAANQPRIVIAGAVQAGIKFDGSNDILVSSANCTAGQKFTMFVKGTIPTTATQIILESSAAFNTANGNIMYADAGKTFVGSGVDVSHYRQRSTTTDLAGQVMAARIDRTSDDYSIYSAGLVQSMTDESAGALPPTGNCAAAPWYFGARSGGTIASDGTYQGLAIYEDALAEFIVIPNITDQLAAA